MSEELEKTVVELEVGQRLLYESGSVSSSGQFIKHEASIATTADGKKYLIEKGVAPDGQPELKRIGGDKGSRIVRIGRKLPPGFQKTKSIPVQQSVTLNDLLTASGDDYNCLLDNCWNSVEQMEKLVTGELGLPWQTKAGIGVGVAAVALTALFALGKQRQDQRH